jgi:hypothetical protein
MANWTRKWLAVGALAATAGAAKQRLEPNAIRAAHLQLVRALGLMGKAASVDVTTVIMRGFERKFPDAYRPVIGRWLKGEKLPEAEQVNIPSAAAK